MSIRLFSILPMVLACTVLSGCGSVNHNLKLKEDYALTQDTRIAVGKVQNATGKSFEDIDPEKMLKDALTEALQEKDLLWTANGKPVRIDAVIVEYEEGNAFKRWLLPGWGSTVLTVRATLREGDRLIGEAHARRTVSIGGGYSIGAWKSIFRDVTEDLVSDIQKKLEASSA